MSYRYIDYGTDTTNADISDCYFNYESGATTTYDNCCYTVYRRTILVMAPRNWKEDDNIAFSKLINKDIQTGWKIDMIINGNVLITDPNVETRTLEEFIPLLKDSATVNEVKKIDAFLKEHPILQ